MPAAEDHVALAGRIAERLRDAGLAVDVVHGGSAALTQRGVTAQHWPAVVPRWATTGGLLATLAIGACARVYPPGAQPVCHPPTLAPRHDQPIAPEAALAATGPEGQDGETPIHSCQNWRVWPLGNSAPTKWPPAQRPCHKGGRCA